MDTVYYAVTGEGRGHATRVNAMVESMRTNARVVVYAPDMAYDFLAPIYANTDVRVRQIPGLSFHYNHSRRLAFGKTGWHGARYLAQLPRLLTRLRADMAREAPYLVITDFEPSLPRAARQMGIPYISLNHQHFLKTYDLSSLPTKLRLYASYMAPFVDLYHRHQQETVVSSFYFPPLKETNHKVTQIGVLLRPAILKASVTHGSHLVVYLRRFMSPAVYAALRAAGVPVRLYGLGKRPREGNIQFLEIDPHRFVEDLAGSRALISTAGNQLVGEALYLGKPVLAMPEAGNHEQAINAHFLSQSGAGTHCDLEELSVEKLRQFLDRVPLYRTAIDPTRLCGNQAALHVIQKYLPTPHTTTQPILQPGFAMQKAV